MKTVGHVHFVGSVPMSDARAVMKTLGERFRATLRRIPDGETGDRINWLQFQEQVFARTPQLEAVAGDFDWRNATAKRPATTQFRLRQGMAVTARDLGQLGYASSALASYRDFAALQSTGSIAANARFLVAMPSPYNVISWGIANESKTQVEIAYEARVLEELDEICAAVPHAKLAIQWDCAHDMQAFEGARTPWFSPAKAGIVERLARIGNRVPADVELGYHLCYGSFGGRHFVEPKDGTAMVEITNAVLAAVGRTVEFMHMPVPIERDDDAFFAPFSALRLRPETELYLGLIHDADGVAGSQRRIATARRYVSDFGIATECGFGRRPAETLSPLIELHEQLVRG